MNITVNGKPQSASDELTVRGLLDAGNLNENLVVVEINGDLVQREAFNSRLLMPDDAVEILRFVGGG